MREPLFYSFHWGWPQLRQCTLFHFLNNSSQTFLPFLALKHEVVILNVSSFSKVMAQSGFGGIYHLYFANLMLRMKKDQLQSWQMDLTENNISVLYIFTSC